MNGDPRLPDTTPTMTIDTFWEWVTAHPNCILRAGTGEMVIFDDEDLHWHLARDGTETLLVQLIRGKRLVAEMLIPYDRIAYVQGGLGDQRGEYLFELVVGSDGSEPAHFFFVLTHGLDTEEELDSRRVH